VLQETANPYHSQVSAGALPQHQFPIRPAVNDHPIQTIDASIIQANVVEFIRVNIRRLKP
jgi:hypothetical protein